MDVLLDLGTCQGITGHLTGLQSLGAHLFSRNYLGHLPSYPSAPGDR
jgi:hypothetical protein